MKSSLLLIWVFLAFTSNVFADWMLDTEESTLSFVTIKKNNIAEVSQFKQFVGSIDNKGKVSLSIDLSTVDTKISIRDERIKKHLFNASSYGSAMLEGFVDMSRISSLKLGGYYTDIVELTLSLHGVEKPVLAEVTVVKLDHDKWLVSSARPVIVNAGDHGLVKGIEVLKKLAGLESISFAVPVTFELIFKGV
ncbi:MAG: polyisoprenoid-binding protein YceI [Oceanicoccus sp.]|jgi:polyisoprenoid-binding protein YceI